MKSLLVVDSDRSSLQSLVTGLARFADEYRVLEARNGLEAMQILASGPVDMVATELDMPVMDGFELAAYVLEHYPSVEIVLIGAAGSSRVAQALTAGGAFHYLPKPAAAQALVDIMREKSPTATKGPIEGLSLAGFLQLLNSENKSCSLRVEAKGGRGRVDLVEGEIVHAVAGELRGRQALYALLAWEKPQIEAEEPRSEVDRTINSPLPRLLLEAAFWQDRFAGYGQPRRQPRQQAADSSGPVGPAPESVEWASPAELVEIRRRLLALLELDGAIGAAVVDMEHPECSVLVSLDPRFSEIATRAGQLARRRLQAMTEGDERYRVRQIKLPSPDRFGLLRLVRSKPGLVLYFVGEMDRADMEVAGAMLADVERILAGRPKSGPGQS